MGAAHFHRIAHGDIASSPSRQGFQRNAIWSELADLRGEAWSLCDPRFSAIGY
jgi:hypothetical protein